jgi:hypothetical protein
MKFGPFVDLPLSEILCVHSHKAISFLKALPTVFEILLDQIKESKISLQYHFIVVLSIYLRAIFKFRVQNHFLELLTSLKLPLFFTIVVRSRGRLVEFDELIVDNVVMQEVIVLFKINWICTWWRKHALHVGC